MTDWTLKTGARTPVGGPILAVVLDGVGLGPHDEGNAFFRAHTPVLDGLLEGPSLALKAHGTAVGLPSDGDMGNSEVGHNALGAGRIFDQGAKLVDIAVTDGSLFEGDTWQWLVDGVRASGGTLHFMGLLSDGNVHSHERHLHSMLRVAAQVGVQRARVHVLLDGRDVGERTAEIYLDRLDAVLASLNTGGRDYQIASGGGRMVVTMDRYEADWDMVRRGWQHHVLGEGRRFHSAREALHQLREESGATDQFLPPFVIADDSGPVGPIIDGDSVCFFNFRGDRAIEISRAFEDQTFDGFTRGAKPNVRFAGMMQYDGDLKIPTRFLVAPPAIDRTLGGYLAYQGVTQFACSETQKYGHVTYFWNGNRSGYFDESVERYVEIPSDLVPFEERPWMKASEIVDATLDALKTTPFQFGRINIANGDMVGHTGDVHAAITAMAVTDLVLGRLLRGVRDAGGLALVTADHGNCEEMFERDKKTGQFALGDDGRYRPKTSHTKRPVPFALYDPHRFVPQGLRTPETGAGLANLPATVLDLLGFAAPEDYLPSLLCP
ncbi:MAG: 2,3-bisphosphoglycerate-independent phosphoglycerate mutase [Myxococcota bacterium]|nr:2,3-bisphosphoglycerate-independent phosphoglycerate mutase [Myxococcota bacterium]